MGFIRDRFINVKEIEHLKEPWRQESFNVNVQHDENCCDAYKEFKRLITEEKVNEEKALKSICAIFEIEPNQLFIHRDCSNKTHVEDIRSTSYIDYMNNYGIKDIKIDFNFKDLFK